MDEPEHINDDPVSVLAALFSEPNDKPTRGCRKYVLEHEDGTHVFRRLDSGPAVQLSELEIEINQIFDELCGDDIVPQKLAKYFPRRSIG